MAKREFITAAVAVCLLSSSAASARTWDCGARADGELFVRETTAAAVLSVVRERGS